MSPRGPVSKRVPFQTPIRSPAKIGIIQSAVWPIRPNLMAMPGSWWHKGTDIRTTGVSNGWPIPGFPRRTSNRRRPRPNVLPDPNAKKPFPLHMNKIGIYYAYWTHNWDADFVPYVAKVKRLGFDILEVNSGTVTNMPDSERDRLKRAAEKAGIELTYCIGLPSRYDIASPDAGVRREGMLMTVPELTSRMSKPRRFTFAT